MSWKCRKCNNSNSDEIDYCPNCVLTLENKIDEISRNVDIIIVDRDKQKQKVNDLYNAAFELECVNDDCAEIPGHKCQICRFLEKVRYIREK
jgi:hypothetical protein